MTSAKGSLALKHNVAKRLDAKFSSGRVNIGGYLGPVPSRLTADAHLHGVVVKKGGTETGRRSSGDGVG